MDDREEGMVTNYKDKEFVVVVERHDHQLSDRTQHINHKLAD